MIAIRIDYTDAQPEEIINFQKIIAIKTALEFLATEGVGFGIKLEINIPKAKKVKTLRPAKVVDPVYPNRGEKWIETENNLLRHLWKSEKALDDVTQQFGRTTGALAAQVVKLGLVADMQTVLKINVSRGGVYGSIPSILITPTQEH